mmetsp:Transcript_76902/g.213685  ORF Transcript_76902/g.213685 Transcript_76902/m.213685 type:complete len:278 (+) Transcript_76902:132-965(+)
MPPSCPQDTNMIRLWRGLGRRVRVAPCFPLGLQRRRAAIVAEPKMSTRCHSQSSAATNGWSAPSATGTSETSALEPLPVRRSCAGRSSAVRRRRLWSAAPSLSGTARGLAMLIATGCNRRATAGSLRCLRSRAQTVWRTLGAGHPARILRPRRIVAASPRPFGASAPGRQWLRRRPRKPHGAPGLSLALPLRFGGVYAIWSRRQRSATTAEKAAVAQQRHAVRLGSRTPRTRASLSISSEGLACVTPHPYSCCEAALESGRNGAAMTRCSRSKARVG